MWQRCSSGGGGSSEPILTYVPWANSFSPQDISIPQNTYMVILVSDDTSGSVNMYNNSSTSASGVTKTYKGNVCIYENFENGGTITISAYSSSGNAICVTKA